MDEGLLAVLFYSFSGFEDPSGLYGIKWEEQETEELLAFVKQASLEVKRRGIRPQLPSVTLRITKSLRIYFGDNELKIRPMAKTVLLLFLKHPEGIALKKLSDYESEVSSLYRKVSRSSQPEEIEKRITRLLDLFNNDLNVNIARVNKAVSALVDGSDHYQIRGCAGKPKGIPLDRKWVIWE